MHREILLACLPHVAAMAVSALALRLLVALSGARLELTRLRRLHRDQLGGVQSLSFVLTVPVFMMIMMFIVQLSQLMIAKIVVEYAAFAAARAAIVWIPANAVAGDAWGGPAEPANCIGELEYRGYAKGEGDWARYTVRRGIGGSGKCDMIRRAAAMACMSICPSRDLGVVTAASAAQIADSLEKAYLAFAPSQSAIPRVPARLRNKLAYALENTEVLLEIRHSEEAEPPLYDAIGGEYDYHESHRWYDPYFGDPDDYELEFAANEIGFQDQVLVTVVHNFALLPGPFQFLRRRFDWLLDAYVYDREAEASYGANPVPPQDRGARRAFVHAVKATVRLTNEGDKSVLPYVQGGNGWLHGSGPPHQPPQDCVCNE